MKRMRKQGFTLIEVLLVVVVMLLLAGFLFRVARLVADRANQAKARADLQMLANALEEFYGEYGNYPPVRWGDPSWENAPVASGEYGMRHLSMMYQYVPERPHPVWPELVHTDPLLAIYGAGNVNGADVGYHYGLMSFLLLRERDEQQNINYIRDSRRDEIAKRRWQHYLANIDYGGEEHTMFYYGSGGRQRVWQLHVTALDPWGRSYGYEAYPPFLSYRLWSAGPSGRDNIEVPDHPDNADNIEVSSP